MGVDPQQNMLKAAVGMQAQELAPIGPQILFPAARIDIIRAQDPVTGVPIVNLVIGAGNGALSVVCPIPAVANQEGALHGQFKPATVLVAEKLLGPDYRVVRVDSSGREDAPATGNIEVEAEIDAVS